MKLAKKILETSLQCSTFELQGGDVRAEANSTSMDWGHTHKFEMDARGNGRTIKTLVSGGYAGHDMYVPTGDSYEHEHEIVDGEIMPSGEDNNTHTHVIIA